MTDYRRCHVCGSKNDLYGSVCRPCRGIYRCAKCKTRLRQPAKLCGLCNPQWKVTDGND